MGGLDTQPAQSAPAGLGARGVLTVLLLIALVPAARGAPLGLPAIDASTSTNPALAALGKALFEDKRLSIDGTMSCATCHVPTRHFADGRPVAQGLHGEELTRHTPSLLNVRYASALFWDGRAETLEAQVRSPLLGPKEHGLASAAAVETIVRADPSYVASFSGLLGRSRDSITLADIASALTAYERTLVAGDSAFDRYEYAGDRSAISPGAIRGLALFRGRAQCATCHTMNATSALFSDGLFHPSPIRLPTSTLAQLGRLTSAVATLRRQGDTDRLNALIGSDRDIAALGRFAVTLDPKDIGQFKTPSLRNVALVGPYMHDGSIATLPAAIELELYSRSSANYPIVLTEDEQADLLQFLQALTSSDQR
jgi:cytochrome c peroxidase